MREFRDADGHPWSAGVVCREGLDYQGRYSLVFRRPDSERKKTLWVSDVRWNSELTARRTLETMSDVELRRRLRTAVGRNTEPDPRSARGRMLPGAAPERIMKAQQVQDG